MEPLFSFTRHEITTTAVVVVPAMLMWITTERLMLALLCGALAYGAYILATDAAHRERAVMFVRDLYSRARLYARTRTTQQA